MFDEKLNITQIWMIIFVLPTNTNIAQAFRRKHVELKSFVQSSKLCLSKKIAFWSFKINGLFYLQWRALFTTHWIGFIVIVFNVNSTSYNGDWEHCDTYLSNGFNIGAVLINAMQIYLNQFNYGICFHYLFNDFIS